MSLRSLFLRLYYRSSSLSPFRRADRGVAVLGQFCKSSLEQIAEVEGFLTHDSQISEAQFGTTACHLHTLKGSAAVMRLEALKGTVIDLGQSMKLAKQPSGISGVF